MKNLSGIEKFSISQKNIQINIPFVVILNLNLSVSCVLIFGLTTKQYAFAHIKKK